MEYKIMGLTSPEGAQTDGSAAVIWDKADTDMYKVFVDGAYAGVTARTDYTKEFLEPDSEHTIYVMSADGKLKSDEITVRTLPKSRIYNIIDFGADRSGKTVCTEAIQRAIDECEKGGTVYIPSGTFVSGALYLKGDMTLRVDGRLVGSTDLSDYPIKRYGFEGLESDCYTSLINTYDGAHENIIIRGHGTIDASGAELRRKQLADNKGRPGRAVCIRNTRNLYFKDITIRQSPAWCLHTLYCENVTLNNVTINTKYDETGKPYSDIVNGDGFDLDSCRNVYVFNCDITSEDDCIAIKSGRNEEGRRVGIPSENIFISGCRFSAGFGVAVGSEMSGSVRNVHVRDCIFDDTYSVASIKPPRPRGGRVENILYERCVHRNGSTEFRDCRWFRGAINIDMFYGSDAIDDETAEEVNESTPVIDGVCLRDITTETVAGNAIFIAGLPESPIKNLTLENITAHGKYGMKAYNVDGLTLKNVSVTADEGESMLKFNVR